MPLGRPSWEQLRTATIVELTVAYLQEQRQNASMSDYITKILINRDQMIRVMLLHDCCEVRGPLSDGLRCATPRRRNSVGH